MLPVYGVTVSVTFHLTYFYIILVLFWLLSGDLFGNSCTLRRPFFVFYFDYLVIIVISCFGFKGWIWVVEAPDEGKPSKMNFGGQKVPEISFV